MAVVGHIARTHGIRGQMVVNPLTDFLEDRFHAGAELFLGRGSGDWFSNIDCIIPHPT